jgi:hypothetical protein
LAVSEEYLNFEKYFSLFCRILPFVKGYSHHWNKPGSPLPRMIATSLNEFREKVGNVNSLRTDRYTDDGQWTIREAHLRGIFLKRIK